MRYAFVCVALWLATGCGTPRLTDATGDIAFAPVELDFGDVWEGDEREERVRIQNLGRSALTVTWTVPDGFTFSELPQTLPPGAKEIVIRYRAGAPGDVGGKLTARAEDTRHTAALTLAARSKAIPECPQAGRCHQMAFDKSKSACMETPVADGTVCEPNSACVTGGTCQAGACVGTEVKCDDGNLCTVDVCNALTGCEFLPAPPCPGDYQCQLGVCDPKTGCGLKPAEDGTSCGTLTCDAAEICISGSCVVRDPPDGTVCAEASPCQTEGTCQASTCVQAPATKLTPTWSLDTALEDPRRTLHDFVMAPTGDMSLMGFFSKPVLRASSANPVSLDGPARRCIHWNGQLACADYRENSGDGRVVVFDAVSGQQKWVFELAAVRQDFAIASEALFMARIVALGSDRIAALYESYPKGSTTGTQCRGYYLVILDTAGKMIHAQKLVDPLLLACNHPHPFGVASDTAGNLYMAFSPSSGNAPLAPQAPTLLLSYDRHGKFRWRREEPYGGGELAVASGRVYPEGAIVPYDSKTGEPLFSSSGAGDREPLGRAVVSATRYVTSPWVSPFVTDSSLHAYTHNSIPDWTYHLSGNESFLSRELRMARWQASSSRPSELVVLAFATRDGQPSLVAVRERNGTELWKCAVDAPVMSAPQLFETANGYIGLMGGALTCGDCDPPFANSSASFYRFDAPGLTVSEAPWPGTFGGADHDHLENGNTLPPSTSPPF